MNKRLPLRAIVTKYLSPGCSDSGCAEDRFVNRHLPALSPSWSRLGSSGGMILCDVSPPRRVLSLLIGIRGTYSSTIASSTRLR